MAAVVNVAEGQTDMPYKGEHHTLTRQNMRHQVCPSDTCHITLSESNIEGQRQLWSYDRL